jgi:hypothetical protein
MIPLPAKQISLDSPFNEGIVMYTSKGDITNITLLIIIIICFELFFCYN